MEEFERGFPNQHTTHRDTRYICMQTFASARGPSERDREKERGWTRTDAGVEGREERQAAHEGRRNATLRDHERGVACSVRETRIYIFIRVRCVKHTRVHIYETHARG